jgi:hypothetical protein
MFPLHLLRIYLNYLEFFPRSFVGEGMSDDAGLVFAYYKEGASDPTFLYFAHGVKVVKC